MSGRYDGDQKKTPTYRYAIALLLLIFAMITVFSLLGDDSKSEAMCAEITTLMLDDSEHNRLHNDYPAIMMELHQFLDKSCINVEDEMGIEINNPDRISINVGDP